MDNQTNNPKKKPILVSLGLWAIHKRGIALTYMWLCIAAAVVSAWFSFLPGTGLLLAALWYWYAVRWMDKNQGWE